eukprot:m.449509 g.449509  ORF g.449509 m.449509 type:complete len:153 (-) comp19835_c0_seq1:220-678(-)
MRFTQMASVLLGADALGAQDTTPPARTKCKSQAKKVEGNPAGEGAAAVVVAVLAAREYSQHVDAAEAMILERFPTGVRVKRCKAADGEFVVTVAGDRIHSKREGHGFLDGNRPAAKRMFAAIEEAVAGPQGPEPEEDAATPAVVSAEESPER